MYQVIFRVECVVLFIGGAYLETPVSVSVLVPTCLYELAQLDPFQGTQTADFLYALQFDVSDQECAKKNWIGHTARAQTAKNSRVHLGSRLEDVSNPCRWHIYSIVNNQSGHMYSIVNNQSGLELILFTTHKYTSTFWTEDQVICQLAFDHSHVLLLQIVQREQ